MIDPFCDCNQRGCFNFDGPDDLVEITPDSHDIFMDIDLLRKGDLRKIQDFCQLWTYLTGIAVDRLTSTKDQIVFFYLLYGSGKDVGSRQSIRAGKRPIAQEYRLVNTHGECLPQGVFSLGGAHGQDADVGAGVLLTEGERGLQGVPVVGDSLRDLQAARRVGARPILVLTGNGEKTRAALTGEEVEVYADLAAVAEALVTGTDNGGTPTCS